MLWSLIVILVCLWALGYLTATAGSLIHLLLIIAVVVLVYDLLVSHRRGP
jgi:hypothetical protein